MGIVRNNRVIPYAELESIVEEVTRAEFYNMGLRIIKEYFQYLSPYDRGTYVKGHRLKFTGRGFNVKMSFINEVTYAKYIEEGRDPGKRPPLQAILAWVRRKGLGEVYNINTRKLVHGRNRKTGKFLRAEDFLERVQVRVAKKIAAKIAFFGQPGKWLYRDVEKYNAAIISSTTSRIKERVTILLNG